MPSETEPTKKDSMTDNPHTTSIGLTGINNPSPELGYAFEAKRLESTRGVFVLKLGKSFNVKVVAQHTPHEAVQTDEEYFRRIVTVSDRLRTELGPLAQDEELTVVFLPKIPRYQDSSESGVSVSVSSGDKGDTFNVGPETFGAGDVTATSSSTPSRDQPTADESQGRGEKEEEHQTQAMETLKTWPLELQEHLERDSETKARQEALDAFTERKNQLSQRIAAQEKTWEEDMDKEYRARDRMQHDLEPKILAQLVTEFQEKMGGKTAAQWFEENKESMKIARVSGLQERLGFEVKSQGDSR